jgi:hypothetical protein
MFVEGRIEGRIEERSRDITDVDSDPFAMHFPKPQRVVLA